MALPGVIVVAMVSASGCSVQHQTRAVKESQVIIDGNRFSAGAPTCRQQQMYRSIDISTASSHIEAVVLLKADTAIPQWVKIHDFGGFTGSFWNSGVGDAHASIAQQRFTITGNAYGINNNDPNKVITTDFTIVAEC
ncbi:MAG: lipoprotein LpqH [Mycobacteriaceae bacterium]|nr:lipoprotein LpqH [Mycobacteriaceae bacterium]